ncbi:transcription factor MYB3R-3 isoform X2 [Phalaenopsis equestris]|uniref:transcription factor MYB3R-3 isoform X2 n=1 Tax=Phalaenopsis equestris TaxID=78828 RepID=UPI0009E3BC45|nr:transcription factor MYB3R-3 isoform X2 [Phalaenopsis equestris]
MNYLKTEESCVENKQSVTASCSSISEGSSGFSTFSPTCSPVTSSPNHRRTSGPIRRAKGGWTPNEDETLRHAVELHKGRNWKKIAESVPGRTEVQCLHRWQKVLNPKLIKGPWTPEEDNVIIELVAKYGPTKWSVIAGSLPGRIGKQCRERSDNSIKNHWNSSLRKRSEVYVKTGKFPHIQKSVIRNAAKDGTNSGDTQLFFCSSKELHTSGNTVLGSCLTVPRSLPTETPKAVSQKDEVLTLSAQVSELNATLDIAVRLSDSSEINLVQNRSESVVNLDAYSFNGEVHRNEEPFETKLLPDSDNVGFLCYKPPELEDLGAAAFSPILFGHRSMQPTSDHQMISSPISYSTPSSANVPRSEQPSVESILKGAARSFPNTPSIIKRRKEVHISLPPETMHTNEIKIQDDCTPKEGSISKQSKLFTSPVNISGGSLDYGKNLNFSPVYQLRSKRKATFKSLEKQLDFTMEDADLESNTKSSSLAANKNSCSPTNMQFLSV